MRMEEKLHPYIFKDLRTSTGSTDSGRLYICVNTSTGETEAIMEHTISKRVPITRLKELENMYDRLHNASWQKIVTLEDILDISEGIVESHLTRRGDKNVKSK